VVHGQLKATVKDWILWACGKRNRVRIEGDSMAPTLRPEDHVLIDPTGYSRRPPRVGDVVLTKHPFQSDVLLVKRIASIDATGRLFVIGDNPDESSDSRSFGSLRTDAVIGKVVGKVP